jgi:hypothetical protein
MNLAEKSLYHQIHPAKLATDIGAEIVSLYLLWQHLLIAGLVSHFAPPIMASLLVMQFADLERYKHSRLGRYVGRMMTATIQATRLIGDVVMVFGAWVHVPLVILAGLAIVIAAWLSGLVGRLDSKAV